MVLRIIEIGLLIFITIKIRKIMTDQEQAAADLRKVSDQLKKIGGETKSLLEKIAALEEAANNNAGGISDELRAAIDDVKSQAQVVDDNVPDAETSTEETTSTETTTETEG